MAVTISTRTFQVGHFRVTIEIGSDTQQKSDASGYYQEKTVVPIGVKTIAQKDASGNWQTLDRQEEYVDVAGQRNKIAELEAALIAANQKAVGYRRQLMGLDETDTTDKEVS